jgi:hypothetical protein
MRVTSATDAIVGAPTARAQQGMLLLDPTGHYCRCHCDTFYQRYLFLTTLKSPCLYLISKGGTLIQARKQISFISEIERVRNSVQARKQIALFISRL